MTHWWLTTVEKKVFSTKFEYHFNKYISISIITPLTDTAYIILHFGISNALLENSFFKLCVYVSDNIILLSILNTYNSRDIKIKCSALPSNLQGATRVYLLKKLRHRMTRKQIYNNDDVNLIVYLLFYSTDAKHLS